MQNFLAGTWVGMVLALHGLSRSRPRFLLPGHTRWYSGARCQAARVIAALAQYTSKGAPGRREAEVEAKISCTYPRVTA